MDGCIEWEGRKHSAGYGMIYSGGKKIYAHRAAYESANGPIPKGMHIDHICRNRRCVNPEHLRIVTPRQNALENSISVPSKNVIKMYCSVGHKYDKGNTYYRPDGHGRMCKECSRIADIKRQHTEKRILSHRRATLKWSQKHGKDG